MAYWRMSHNSCVPVMHVDELANQGYRTLKGVAAKLGNDFMPLKPSGIFERWAFSGPITLHPLRVETYSCGYGIYESGQGHLPISPKAQLEH